MDKPTHQIRCEHWLKLIKECLSSGMKKNEWCRINGISEKAFYYWQRILRNEAYIETVAPKQAPVLALDASKEVSFVELKVPSFSETSHQEFRPSVIIRHGSVSMEISNQATPELVKLLGDFMNVK